ncbi:MAG: hypothetical protein PHW52_00260 [Candidatus Pacebacteria bacterium]|nr:hypothetical protein [Candidatus Paceibacterota bacterium]
MNNLQKIFIEIRDIPYSIPLAYEAEDRCCTGKHKKFFEILKKDNYEVRWKVCTFKWSSMSLPENLLTIPHDDNSTHAYLEVLINEEWKKVDATWDKFLEKILPINEWDGVSDTRIAIPVISTYSPEESLLIMESESRKIVEADLEVNGSFYKAFNAWLEEVRLRYPL